MPSKFPVSPHRATSTPPYSATLADRIWPSRRRVRAWRTGSPRRLCIRSAAAWLAESVGASPVPTEHSIFPDGVLNRYFPMGS
jgi:hypothetical protein